MKLFTAVKSFLITCGLLLLSGCISVQQKPTLQILSPELTQQGVVIDLKTGNALTPDELINRLASHQRIVVGEKHDNPYHHQIELWLVQQLLLKREHGSVLLEMITPDQQEKVNKVKNWLQTKPTVRESRIKDLLAWNAGWPWELYGELVLELMYQPYPLLAANLARSEIKAAYSNPPILQGNISVAENVKAQIAATIKDAHGGEITEQQLSAMTTIQQMRDRRMAEQLIKAPVPATLIAGGYHATKVMGVPLHIKDLSPREDLVVLILAEKANVLDSQHADYIWYTPVKKL
ncbi:ChaN family lipoprotein [Photorhabdus heterorhabditis]|uniref:Iron-regulated protein n=1 Tax=Photorhabdus heterorhabditis TaxID=880156 RepID=A0A5B0WK95_9GAMM|nr:ChaN family lipoprotein [Photorhabdus heterorhabditis]KAA1186369.1 iron-regulated protein [Photorhabdus heterorhabditis]KOY63402.1 iron-regulated protein [Photorhabdus heterorhabditis]MBS9442202.1 iron-regulated protein [Photorhabdus heterorhabditis]